ncbi:UNVERIFIED_CONTAM: hypothetical protein K2H54_009971 [Gekko kuhli]
MSANEAETETQSDDQGSISSSDPEEAEEFEDSNQQTPESEKVLITSHWKAYGAWPIPSGSLRQGKLEPWQEAPLEALFKKEAGGAPSGNASRWINSSWREISKVLSLAGRRGCQEAKAASVRDGVRH